MTTTLEEIKTALSAEEPDYKALANQFGSESISHLKILARSDDPLMASKAVYLSSAITDSHSIDILKDAAEDPKPEVRIAAASGVSNLIVAADRQGVLADVNMTGVNEILDKLKNDSDVGVSKVARRSLDSTGDRFSKKDRSEDNKS